MAEQMLQELCDIQNKAKNLSQQIHSSMVNQQGAGGYDQGPPNGMANNYSQQGRNSGCGGQQQQQQKQNPCCPQQQQQANPCPPPPQQQRRSFQCPPPPQQQQQCPPQQQQQQCPPQQQQQQQQCPPQQQQQQQQQCPPPPQQQQCPPQQQQQQCPPPPQQQQQCPPSQEDDDCNEEQNNIKVCEIDASGSHIKIYNAGSKMEYISGYFIVQTQKDCCLSIYKIPPCVYLSGQSYIKIWTCPFQNNPNKLPSDLVFKELTKWKNGSDVLTTLYRCDGKPVSCLRGSYV